MSPSSSPPSFLAIQQQQQRDLEGEFESGIHGYGHTNGSNTGNGAIAGHGRLGASGGVRKKKTKTLIEIQEEEQARQAEEEFLRWWAVEEERVRKESERESQLAAEDSGSGVKKARTRKKHVSGSKGAVSAPSGAFRDDPSRSQQLQHQQSHDKRHRKHKLRPSTNSSIAPTNSSQKN